MIAKKMENLLEVLDAVMGAVQLAGSKRSRNGVAPPSRPQPGRSLHDYVELRR